MKPKSRRRSSNNTQNKSHGSAMNAKQNDQTASPYDFGKLSKALNAALAEAEEDIQDTACSNYNPLTLDANAEKQNTETTSSAYEFSKLSEALNVIEDKQKQAAERYKVRRQQRASMRSDHLYWRRLFYSKFLESSDPKIMGVQDLINIYNIPQNRIMLANCLRRRIMMANNFIRAPRIDALD
ncbi:hypothetical protein FH972_011185 [Carpinus fangiana]|uniref:Uncharacterized protein n=1 Tax=Carpinus fangiana TaxID=176857 RepID=A0A660KXK1_9ROSI|nr:hypothetical protein FH972_011185 [Carpinus fangiana]